MFTVVDDKAKLYVILYKTELLSFSELTQEEKKQSTSKIPFNKDIPDFNASWCNFIFTGTVQDYLYFIYSQGTDVTVQ